MALSRAPRLDLPVPRLDGRQGQPYPALLEARGSGAPTGTSAAGTSGGGGRLFRACILLLLREQPAHGYDLLERLATFGFDAGDSGWLYRTLRRFEREAMVASSWEVSSSGPPRRVYALTERGRRLLDAWAVAVRADRRAIDDFLDRHRAATGRHPGDGEPDRA